MKWTEQGSYTVEGAVIISFICLIVALVVGLGFYCHDRMVLQGAADELAMYGSNWVGRYVDPVIKEVDYEGLKYRHPVSFDSLISKGYKMLQGRLLWGKSPQISIEQSYFGKEVEVKINSSFLIGSKAFLCKVSSSACVIRSRDLPRTSRKEQGDDNNEP